MHFMTNLKCLVNIPISYKDNLISNTYSIKFLGLSLDSTLSWKIHIEQLRSRLNSAFYVIRSLKSFISINNLGIIYFSYVQSIITYGIIFLGISPYSHGIFKLQKRVIRIIMNVNNRESCCQFFKTLQILPLYSQYMKSIALFVVKNIDEFVSNSEFHSINTRYRSDLHIPTVHLTKGVYHSGIFNHLLQNIKNLSQDVKKFESALNKFLLAGSFYTLEEYFE